MADRSTSGVKKKESLEPVKVLKHFDTFYNQVPPGLVQEERERPEDCIPDCPENKEAREFLSKAPTRGLWMPLGKEVKVMKCWRCKAYGHRTGDRECPLFVSGNAAIEKFRFVYAKQVKERTRKSWEDQIQEFLREIVIHEDPMHNLISEKKKAEKLARVEQLKALLEADTDSSSSSSGESVEAVGRKRKQKHKKHHKSKKRKKKKK